MFKVRIEAPETYRSSVRPVILASVRQVMDDLNLNKNVLTFFNGESEISRMIGTNFTDGIGADKKTDVGYHDRQFIVAEESEAGVLDGLDSCHRWVMNQPFWQDPITGSMIVPMYVLRKYTVSINRYFKDRVMARQYRDRIHNTLVNPHINTFNAIVHYPISYQMMECFEDIHTRLVNANVVDPKIDSLQWFKNNSLVPTDVITNLIGNNACFVFKRCLEDITLMFSGIDIAKAQKGKYQGQYLATLEYSFYLSEHTRYELHYPIMVYQQLTDPIYIPQFNEKQLDDYPTSQFYEGTVAQKHKSPYMSKMAPYMFVFPKEDNFRPPKLDYLILKLQRLAIMEDKENQLVMNIFKFADMESFWLERYERYIKKYHNKITKRHKSPLHIKLWSDDIEVDENQITLDEEGNLFLKHRPTMSAQYRVCFYFDWAGWLYDDDTVDDIIHDDENKDIIDDVYPDIPKPGDKEYPGDKKPGDKPWIDWEDDIIDKIIDRDDQRKLHMMDGFIIADNEYLPYRNPALTVSIRDYLRRKNKSG